MFKRLFYITVFLTLISIENTVGQSCTITYINHNYALFGATGGNDIFYIDTDPSGCIQAIDCPEWITYEWLDDYNCEITCLPNSGNARGGLLSANGSDFFYLYQEGSASPFYPGTISGTSLACYNSSPGTLTGTSAYGGYCNGSYSYQWEMSSTSTEMGFSEISGGTGISITPSAQTSTRYYRRKDSCNGQSVYTNVLTVTVNPALNAGQIGGVQTICYNADPSIITSTVDPTGGTGPLSYQWQYSTDGGSNWNNKSGATSTTFDPSYLDLTTSFRRRTIDNIGCSVYSSSIVITVREALSGGEIEENQDILYGTVPATISSVSSASGGSTSFTYQWFSSVNQGTDWTSIDNATGTSFSPGALVNETSYKRDATNAFCTVSSNVVSVSLFRADLDTNSNYIYTALPNEKVQTISGMYSLGLNELQQSVTYFDGLGRPMQNNIIMGSPAYKDIVTPIIYDEIGREAVKYLSYSTTEANYGRLIENAISSQGDYYDSLFVDEPAYAKTIFENSPLNRVLQQGAPGIDWQPGDDPSIYHPVRFMYETNNSTDNVKLWVVVNNTSISTTGSYSAGKLQKTTVKDENWTSGSLNTTEEYKDLQGKIVLKKAYVLVGTTVTPVETYYIYDNFGLLRFVLPPKAVANLGATTTLNWDTQLVKDLCYYYKYDGRQRLILKQLPGADPVYMVYDNRDRLVAIQDGNRRDSEEWIFTKYNVLNNPVLTGIYVSSASRETLQTVANTFTGDSLFEIAGTAVHGYTNRSFPNVSDFTKYYTVTYYDDYTYSGAKSFNTSVNISGYSDSDGNFNYFDGTRSLVTGTKTLVLDGGSTYLMSTIYYDDKYRPIQLIRDLYDGYGGVETTSNKYDFIGQVLEAKVSQIFNNVTTTLNKYYTYDHMGRLLKTEQSIAEVNNGEKVILAEMQYNELGQLKQKKLNVTTSGALNTVDYKYNIRGWLTDINDPAKLKSDLFAMSLYYNNSSVVSPLTTAAQYNGNISGIKWKSGQVTTDTVLKAYGFTYDALNRLVGSDYGEGTGFTSNADRYNESIGSYDFNGNIISLARSGYENPTTYSNYDLLGYTYDGNKLVGVEDSGEKQKGFIDNHVYGSSSPDYEYDENGNVKKDLNKGIVLISYNFLNLPLEVKKDNNNRIVYVYDAIGTKLKKISTIGGVVTPKYYAGIFEYGKTKKLSLIHADEGMVNVDTTRNFTYEYHLKDHLGNIRAVLGSNGIKNQITDFYPFGMISSITQTGNTDNKYLYNGKELQDGLSLDWYDYGARFYDSQLGRFIRQDPMSEKFYDWSLYSYGHNNPTGNIDIGGNFVFKGSSNYPELARVLQNIQRVLDNKTIMGNLQKFTGLSANEIRYQFAPGNGPEIDVKFLGFKERVGETSDNGNITLDYPTVMHLENELKAGNNNEYNDWLFYNVLIILHEFVHSGDVQTHGEFSDKKEPYDNCLGYQFEKATFGSKLKTINNVRSFAGERNNYVESDEGLNNNKNSNNAFWSKVLSLGTGSYSVINGVISSQNKK